MAKRECSCCGKDMGEQVPYENQLTLLDICRDCRKENERLNDKAKNRRIREFLVTSGR